VLLASSHVNNLSAAHGVDFRSARFSEFAGELPHGDREAHTVAQILTSTEGQPPIFLEGEKASKQSLLDLPEAPRVLHVVSHGFSTPKDIDSANIDIDLWLGSGIRLGTNGNGQTQSRIRFSRHWSLPT
jgi:hypothetical protein